VKQALALRAPIAHIRAETAVGAGGTELRGELGSMS
jgi:hypothetical protein